MGVNIIAIRRSLMVIRVQKKGKKKEKNVIFPQKPLSFQKDYLSL